MQLKPDQRRRFDEVLHHVLNELPAELLRRFDEIPLVVEDHPSKSMLDRLGVRQAELLRGLHSGIPLTRRSVSHSGTLPTVITIYRQGISLAATDENGQISDDALRHEIRTTILHELGHHFGLSEADLRHYGYG